MALGDIALAIKFREAIARNISVPAFAKHGGITDGRRLVLAIHRKNPIYGKGKIAVILKRNHSSLLRQNRRTNLQAAVRDEGPFQDIPPLQESRLCGPLSNMRKAGFS